MAGKGDPIVFIPGWRMPGWIWQKQIDGLSDKYRVIAVDPRSQGESDKPNYGHLPETRARDYKQLVDQLGLKQPVLIGWSVGCSELLSYVEQFGEDGTRGLVLVDGLIPANQNPEIVSVMYDWLVQLQRDRQKEAQVSRKIQSRNSWFRTEPVEVTRAEREKALLQEALEGDFLIEVRTPAASESASL